MTGWLNVDIITGGPDNFLYVNIVKRDPFPDNHFRFAVCEANLSKHPKLQRLNTRDQNVNLYAELTKRDKA